MTICAFPLYVLKRQKLGVCVSTLTAMLIFIAFLACVAFQAVKNFQLRNLNVSLRKKDYDMVERLATMATSRRFLGDWVPASRPRRLWWRRSAIHLSTPVWI